MTLSQRDLFFIAVNAVLGVAIGAAERGLLVSRDGALPPLLLIVLGMALVELAAGYVSQTPLGQFVAMPARLIAFGAAFAAYFLVVSI